MGVRILPSRENPERRRGPGRHVWRDDAAGDNTEFLDRSLVKLELRLAIQHLCSRCQSIELHGDFERLADVDVGNWGFRRLNVRLISA
eukprot:s1490_g20.t1